MNHVILQILSIEKPIEVETAIFEKLRDIGEKGINQLHSHRCQSGVSDWSLSLANRCMSK